MYEWCVDNALTPYVVVVVDGSVRVPMEFVQNGEIVLNVSMGATSNLQIGNEYLDFKARFGGVARDISVPVGRITAIYARENGQGMTFPVETSNTAPATAAAKSASAEATPSDPAAEPVKPARPTLTRIK
jgi:stringent starvation protein B